VPKFGPSISTMFLCVALSATAALGTSTAPLQHRARAA
jgi:hypothetical protein